MPSGEGMLARAVDRIGDKYVNLLVPKNNPNWHGPWDCAEFMSWLVYQEGGFLYGCIDNKGNPATTEAYTGAWQRDAHTLGKMVAPELAAATPGAILLRYPPAPGKMGHIVVCDGQGGTVEAMGKAYGVRRGKVSGRLWHTGVLLPGFSYDDHQPMELVQPKLLYGIGMAGMSHDVVEAIQRALVEAGFDPGPVDRDYGHNTTAAVAAFQTVNGLTVDGQVGPLTAKRLKVKLG